MVFTDHHVVFIASIVYRVHDVVWRRRFHSKVPDLYTQVKVGDIKDSSRRTRTIKRSISPHWDDILTLSSLEASTKLNIQVKHESNWSPDPCVGYVDITLADLLKECATGEAQLILKPPHGKEITASVGILHLRLEVIGATTSVEANVKTAAQDIEQRGIVRSAEAVDSTAVILADNTTKQSEQSEMYEALRSLVEKLDVLFGFIDKLSKVHPYLDAAWQVTSALYKKVSNQFQTDKKLVDLVHDMKKTIELIRHAQSLPNKVESLERTIIELLKQITECCLFVRQYTTHGFARRLLSLDNSKKIEEFQQSLSKLGEALNKGNVIYTSFVSARTSNKVESLFLQQKLNPIQESVFERPTCLPGTRVEIQKEINTWLLSETSQNILWLKGVAGSGKSTISTTSAEYFREMSRLGTFLFFERGKSKPSSVIPTIAYALASLDATIAEHVTAAVEQDNNIVNASAKVQFEKLLLGPLTADGADLGPIVIILDALDECGTPEARKSLMRLFKNDFPKLPSQFRFLLTSRPENDIVEALSFPGSVYEVELDYTSDTSRGDVLSYIKFELDQLIRVEKKLKVPEDWPWDKNMELLGKVAGGLFIWASTSVKLVSSSDNPFRKLKELTANSQSLAQLGLKELYATVLRSSGIDWDDPVSKARFAQVLSLLLFSKVPLTSETIDGILGFPSEEPSRLILSRLQCLLDYTPGHLVRLFHTSFSDYLLSPACQNEPWYIDDSLQKQFLASRCFTVMDDKLCFNICGIKTSFICDADAPGLGARIESKIPQHLEYACIYWSQHVCDLPCTPDLLDELSAFCHRSLLYWFEALSLLEHFATIAGQALEAASTWAISNQEVSSFLKDAVRLGSIFSPCITQSVAHIYVSMLPLMKDESIVAAHYSKHMDSVSQIERRGVKAPSVLIKVLQGHTDAVLSANFSPDGKRIVSGSIDGTVRVWDAESGWPMYSPLEGHKAWIKSVSFSPDGKRIVSSSEDRTIIVWDTDSGEIILGPLKGHTGTVTSVNFSPDGKFIVSGSEDSTIRVWDVDSGGIVLGPLKGHINSVTSVNFAPDGKRIVSGSDDSTIRVWDLVSCELMLNPLKGHTDRVFSVNFSPDGKRVVSGSADGTVRVWDADTGDIVLGPLKGHTGYVSSVNFSPDGKRIVSGSYDNTIRVWDTTSGEIMIGPLEGHTKYVTSVNFSADGKRIVSSSFDETTRVWDAKAGEIMLSPLEGHTNTVNAIDFSLDGKYIVSGSEDGTIRGWDAESGELILGPLKGHIGYVTSVNFSPDGKQIVSGSNGSTIIVHNVESGELILGPLEGHSGVVKSVNFSPNGKRIITGFNDCTILVWDIDSRELILGPLEGYIDYAAYCVGFSPDGKYIVSGFEDGTIRGWDAESRELVLGPLEGHIGDVTSVNFSPDGKRIVSGSADRTIRVWDLESGELSLGPLEGHTGVVMSVNFSPNGKRIVSCSNDNTIKVWDAKSGELLLGPLEGHTNPVTSVKFSPDGKRIASGSVDRTIRVWDALSHDTSMVGVSSVVYKKDICWTLAQDGWVTDTEGNLLLWVPHDLHRTLWRPRNTAVFSCTFSTKLDFSRAALGEDWVDCFRPSE